MFDDFYKFRKASITRPPIQDFLIRTHIYVFKTELYPYIVNVEEYAGNVFVIKFFRKQDRQRKNKFSVLTNERKCGKIVSTCIRILLEIREKNELASFGFLGSHTINGDYVEDKEQTQRFRIYKRAMENLIGETHFDHSMDLIHSTYLMVSLKNEFPDTILENAKNMFDEIFPELAD